VSNYQKTVAARERVRKIRVRESILARISHKEDAETIRQYLKHGIGTDGGAL
jgi:hypothetical protein